MELKAVYYRVSDIAQIFEVMVTGDFHLGSLDCDYRRLKEVLCYAKGNNIKMILNGDLLDSIVPGDYRYEREAVALDTMEGQIKCLLSMLEPLKENILAMCSGNHDITIQKKVGINPTRMVAEQLGIPFFMLDGFLILRRRHRRSVVFYLTHGGFSGTMGNVLNKIVSLGGMFGADIYCVGHSHLAMHTKTVFYTPRGKEEKTFISTGGYLMRPKYCVKSSYRDQHLQTPIVTIKYTKALPGVEVNYV